MKSYLIVLLAIAVAINAQRPGFSNLVQTGPKSYTVGININLASYPAGTAYNIANPSNASQVIEVLQKAITDIGNAGGGVVNIKEGTYTCDKNVLILGNKIHLNGAGIDKTIIKLADYAPSFIVGTSKRSGFIRTRSFSNLIFSNMTIDGNKNNQYQDEDHKYGRYGLFTEGSTNIWFDRIRVINCQGYGFDPHGWKSEGIWGQYLTITNCISENNGFDGFTIDQTFNVYVDNCTANNNARHGYNVVTGCQNVTIVNSSATYNGWADPYGGSGCGFMAQNNQEFGTKNITMINNKATNSKKAGFCVDDTVNVKYTNNYIDNTNICFSLNLAKSTVLAYNTCYTNKLLSSKNTTVVMSPGTQPDTYVYNNTLVSKPTNTTTAPNQCTACNSNSDVCTYTYMRCLNATSYQTCNIDDDNNTFWDTIAVCPTGKVCVASGNFIQCQ